MDFKFETRSGRFTHVTRTSGLAAAAAFGSVDERDVGHNLTALGVRLRGTVCGRIGGSAEAKA